MECLTKTANCIATLFALLLPLFDIITDGATLAVYWEYDSRTIFYVSLAILICTLPCSVVVIALEMKQMISNLDEKWKQRKMVLKLFEVAFESVPQLIINLIRVSICGKSAHYIQIISAISSCLSTFEYLLISDPNDMLHPGPMWRRILVFLGIFFTKLVFVTARVLAVSYFCLYLGWWIILVLFINFFCWMNVNLSLNIGWKEYLKVYIVHHFSFMVHQNIVMMLIKPIITTAENIMLVLVAALYSVFIVHNGPYVSGLQPVIPADDVYISNHTHYHQKLFCLYDHILEVNISLNIVAAFLCAMCYFIWYQGKRGDYEEPKE